jgi:hypothetical protein
MSHEIEGHIAAIYRAYEPLILGARLTGGSRLWAQFEHAVSAWRQHGRPQVTGIIERVNELAMAKYLLADPHIPDAEIQYEPEVIAGGARFDFVVPDYQGTTLYVEVKTVHPRTEDTERNWRKVEARQRHLSPGNHYVVAKEWMGATIFGNSFSARSSFLGYALETEDKLEAAHAVRPGRCVLVFCGNGFPWHVSELEDFADFYRTSLHRFDDPLAAMEQHHMTQHQLTLHRTIEAFAAMIRPDDSTEPTKWVYPVRGPIWSM